MGRKRRKDRDLPPKVHRHHGAIYYVHAGRWTRLGVTVGEALAAYGRLIDRPGTSVPELIDAALAAAEARCAPSTMNTYRAAATKLKAALADFDAVDLRPQHVAQVMDAMAGTPVRANQARTLLKQAMALAVRRGLIDRNPVPEVAPHPTRARDRYLTDAELALIWQAAPPWLRCVIDLCYLTAERIGDVLSIRESQLTDSGIEIDQQKSGARLTHAWSDDLREVVARARGLHRHRSIYLLAGSRGQPRKYGNVLRAWSRTCKAAGVEDAHMHDIRAKSLTDAKAIGLDPQVLAGHTSAATTRRYLRGKERVVVAGPKLRRK